MVSGIRPKIFTLTCRVPFPLQKGKYLVKPESKGIKKSSSKQNKNDFYDFISWLYDETQFEEKGFF